MKKELTLVIFVGACALLAACQQQQMAAEDPVERGRYLVTIGSCHDCHTPKLPGPAMELDSTRMLSGHPADAPYPTWMPSDMQRNAVALGNPMLTAWGGPWGVSYTANLTPDKETGLGEWTEEAFIQAIRTGKHQGQPNGRDILPPMPWPMIRNMTDADLKAVWAYLQSLPPIKNQVPTPVPPAQQ